MKKYLMNIGLLLIAFESEAIEIPNVHPNLIEEQGQIFFVEGENKYPLKPENTKYTQKQLVGQPIGTEAGIQFDFEGLNGHLYYGLINQQESRYPQPVFYRNSVTIKKGIAQIKISSTLGGSYDMVNWQETGQGTLGYRVISKSGTILYDGKIAFTGQGPFQVNSASIIEGPFIHFSPEGTFHQNVRLSFDTLMATTVTISVRQTQSDEIESTFTENNPVTHHEISLFDLNPDTTYHYTVQTQSGEHTYSESYSFKTAPLPGSRKPFVFAYTSDSRHGQGGGERRIEGVNAYMMKKIAALAAFKKAAFIQFTGDMINGYLKSVDQMKVEYRNWKRSIEPFAYYLPVLTTMGNHEALIHEFKTENSLIQMDRFPYQTESAEAVFANQFVNPTNGPNSEDGAIYDPNPNQQDFPSYQENVFYYIYDNVAMIVLNSDYWYAPSQSAKSGGNIHGYLMDNQLDWLENTLALLEANPDLDFIFVTHHTPAFPNGGHIGDDMWYGGNNAKRATVKHTPDGENLIQRGIIEQRDKYLKILMNSPKVLGLLTGDEHHFNWLLFDQEMDIYPRGWSKEDIRQSDEFRPLYQVNNGTAGAPYHALGRTPWRDHVQNFTTQNVVVFFHIHGPSIQMEIINPDTLETIWP